MTSSYKSLLFIPLIPVLLSCNNSKDHIFKEGDRAETDSSSGIVQVGVSSSGFREDYDAASKMISENKISEAIAVYKKLVTKEGRDLKTNAYMGLGTAYYLAQKYDSSLVSYKTSIALDTANYYSIVGLGSTYSALDSLNSAVKYYELAKTINPNAPEAYWGLALSYEKTRDTAKAKQNAATFIKLAPNSNYVPLMESLLKSN